MTDNKKSQDITSDTVVIYIFFIDGIEIQVDQKCLTGREILEKAGKTPYDRFQLNQRLASGKVVKVEYDEKVCFTVPPSTTFMTIPLEQTEG